MKYIKQLLIILIFSLAGELLHLLLPMPIPASVYGLILLFLALCTKLVRLDQIESVSQFLIDGSLQVRPGFPRPFFVCWISFFSRM